MNLKTKDPVLARRMRRVIIFLVILFGGIFLYNVGRYFLIKHFVATFAFPPVTISTSVAKAQTWQPHIDAIGNFVAVNGVNVTPEIAGQVVGIFFTSGQSVKAGEPLVQLDISMDLQDLKNYQSQLTLAEISFSQQSTLYTTKATSKSALDQARANLEQSQAATQKTQILINQKTIKAPFAGRLGIRQVNIGQYVSPGNTLVNLQAFNPMLVQFTLPEQHLRSLFVGQTLKITVDTYPDRTFTGKITALDAQVSTATHNILVEGILTNDKGLLFPGMFANVSVMLPEEKNVVTVPQTAIAFSLYGDSIFVVEQKGKDKNNKPIHIVYRRFVTTGDRQDNLIAVTKGLKAGEVVVTSGQLKLENETHVEINNSVQLTGMSNPNS